MEGIGRGRARGRRIINMDDFRQPLPLDLGSGRTMGGRGIPPPPVLRPCPAYTKTFGRGFSADAPEFKPMISCGRGMAIPLTAEQGMPDLSLAGRGMSDLSTPGRGMPDLSTPGRGMPISFSTEQRPHTFGLEESLQTTLVTNNAQDDAKEILERELLAFENRGNGCLIRITLNFFSRNNDVEFYMEKVLNSALRSSKMVIQFAKCLHLLTFLKTHGALIKSKIFSKLQSTFQKMPSFGDISNLNQMERTRLVNFCALIGQIYFRFRPLLGKPERYHVLAHPAGHCMLYLLQARGALELSILVNLVNINYKALCQQAKPKMDELCAEARKALVTGVGTADHRLWIMCTVDHLVSGAQGNQLPDHLAQFYCQQMGSYVWEKVVVASPVQLLADIPSNITPAEMGRFDLGIDTYNLHKFVEL